jgi:hypothetical protein
MAGFLSPSPFQISERFLQIRFTTPRIARRSSGQFYPCVVGEIRGYRCIRLIEGFVQFVNRASSSTSINDFLLGSGEVLFSDELPPLFFVFLLHFSSYCHNPSPSSPRARDRHLYFVLMPSLPLPPHLSFSMCVRRPAAHGQAMAVAPQPPLPPPPGHGTRPSQPSVTEPPKVLGPPTYVFVLRTSDNHVDAHNHSTNSVICIIIISPKSISPIT